MLIYAFTNCQKLVGRWFTRKIPGAAPPWECKRYPYVFFFSSSFFPLWNSSRGILTSWQPLLWLLRAGGFYGDREREEALTLHSTP